MIDSLEWLRPAWLLALPAGALVLSAWWRTHAGVRPWRGIIDAELLEHLAGRVPVGSARLALGIGVAVLVLVCVALAGPVWREQALAQQRDLGGRVVVLDLSPSMEAVDVLPSRLERARHAVGSLLREAAGAQLGLVVFGADAFTVAPLTTDPETLIHLLAGVGAGTVPRAGSRPDLGLDMARAMLKQAGIARGEVILVADSAGDARTLEAARTLADAGFPLSVLAVGTAQGGPIPLASGSFARNSRGEILIAQSEFSALERVAQAGGGRFQLLAPAGDLPGFANTRATPAETAVVTPAERHEGGAWLALLVLPFAALLFRRGWLACLAPLALALALPSQPAYALDWSDLWRRADQQAAAALRRGKSAEHARVLTKLGADSPWHAVLLYRSGQFAEAAAQFGANDTASAHYNRGNAFALDGQLELALSAYDAALARNPAMQDALYNRTLVREALARRPPQALDEADMVPPNRQQRAAPATRSQSPGRGRGDASDPWRRSQADAERAAKHGYAQGEPGQGQDGAEDATQPPRERLSAGELQRLEGLLSQVPDEPQSLLANRFVRHLRMRGTPHTDTGARW